MIERSLGTPDAQAMEATVAEAPLRFEEFFGAGHARLFGALSFMTGDRHEAEEIMQDAFLRLWERWGEVRIADPSAIDVYGIDGERQASLPLPRRMMPHYDSGPGVWMHDGSALLLYGVFVVPLDGGAPYDLSLAGEVSYSPDGTRVAVVTGNSIEVIGVDGSPVSEVDGRLDTVDAWSPDGTGSRRCPRASSTSSTSHPEP
jgi:hypothetical protein